MAGQLLTALAGLVCLVLSSIIATKPAFGYVFTSIADVESLLSTETELLNHLNSAIEFEEIRLEQLKKLRAEYQDINEQASPDVAKYLSNPINAYRLVKRLTMDWKVVEAVLTINPGADIVESIRHGRNSSLRFPSDEDLSGAAAAVNRLQDIYQLDTQSLADGKIMGNKLTRHLSAADCWELGRQSYNKDDHYHTVLWMAEALKRYEREADKTVTRQAILEYLEFSVYKTGNTRAALQLTNELLQLVPSHGRAKRNKLNYERILGLNNNATKRHLFEEKSRNETFSANKLKLTRPIGDAIPDQIQYERLCRGEKLMSFGIESKLRCRYVKAHHPFYTIQRVKLEEANLNPRIVLYHDVISDAEMETAKSLGQPKFKTATFYNPRTGKHEPREIRTSKVGWLKNEEHPSIANLDRRIGHITGLDMSSSEDLQVCNYGIGGHYDPHYDYARAGEDLGFGNGWGNRIATWLFYMSDVEAGGATVFPRLNVSVKPVKGAAAFWYNLHPDGSGNELTYHAACPVLAGSKWVSNKWIHERRQDRIRPCGLKPKKEAIFP